MNHAHRPEDGAVSPREVLEALRDGAVFLFSLFAAFFAVWLLTP